jgi:hypothetical protein
MDPAKTPPVHSPNCIFTDRGTENNMNCMDNSPTRCFRLEVDRKGCLEPGGGPPVALLDKVELGKNPFKHAVKKN